MNKLLGGKILVVGGAGYIGSHMVMLLHKSGFEVVTFDNLSTGYRDSVLVGDFILGDLADHAALRTVFSTNQFDAVMHLASCIQVAESLTNPSKYYRNNVTNSLSLLDTMLEFGVKKFVFSSTAAIFGMPSYLPIDEKHAKLPVNPYGASKLMVERIMADYGTAYGLNSISLRYFNAAGADPECRVGERHDPETHLIPLLLQVVSGRRSHIVVNGNDYETPDGTCIRDYIHVQDICHAHLLALAYLNKYETSASFNLGNGKGYSVREVVDMVTKVTGKKILLKYGSRRIGDSACLLSDSTQAKNQLGWAPQFSDLEKIIEHAWKWELKNDKK